MPYGARLYTPHFFYYTPRFTHQTKLHHCNHHLAVCRYVCVAYHTLLSRGMNSFRLKGDFYVVLLVVSLKFILQCIITKLGLNNIRLMMKFIKCHVWGWLKPWFCYYFTSFLSSSAKKATKLPKIKNQLEYPL